MQFSAPGTYYPEKVKLDTTPQYSFGIKPSLEKANDTPGKYIDMLLIIYNRYRIVYYCICESFVAPGTYSPEKVNLYKGPQYSLTGKGSIEKPANIPGV